LPRCHNPANQEGFHSGVQTIYYHLFKCPILPDGRMLSCIPEELAQVQGPTIKGLFIFGAIRKVSGMRFYGTWTEKVRTFIGWLRLQPHLSSYQRTFSLSR